MARNASKKSRADKAAEPDDPAEQPKRGETVRAVLIAVVLALAIRSFIVEPFKIPSASMVPTLLVGDYVLVSKFAYGVRLPITGTLLFGEEAPERGDVIVFRLPEDPSIDYIKRVIGLPGDRIEIRARRLYINDQLVDRREAEQYMYSEGGRARPVVRNIERNPEGAEYTTIAIREGTPHGWQDEGPFDVPDGHYFMMGDNRDNSLDSRRWKRLKYVEASAIKGKAFLIHWSWVLGGESGDRGFIADLLHTLWKLISFQVEEIRWERIGRSVEGLAAD